MLEHFTVSQLEDLLPGAFDEVMAASEAHLKTHAEMASTPYPSPTHSVLQAQANVQQAVLHQAGEHYQAISAEIRRRKTEAAQLAAEAEELRA